MSLKLDLCKVLINIVILMLYESNKTERYINIIYKLLVINCNFLFINTTYMFFISYVMYIIS